MGPSLVERLNRGNTYQEVLRYLDTSPPSLSASLLAQHSALQRTPGDPPCPLTPVSISLLLRWSRPTVRHRQRMPMPPEHTQSRPPPPPPNRRPAGAVRPGTTGAVPARPASLCAAPRPGGRLPQVLGDRVLPLTYVPRTTHAQESPPVLSVPAFRNHTPPTPSPCRLSALPWAPWAASLQIAFD